MTFCNIRQRTFHSFFTKERASTKQSLEITSVKGKEQINYVVAVDKRWFLSSFWFEFWCMCCEITPSCKSYPICSGNYLHCLIDEKTTNIRRDVFHSGNIDVLSLWLPLSLAINVIIRVWQSSHWLVKLKCVDTVAVRSILAGICCSFNLPNIVLKVTFYRIYSLAQ